MRALVPRFLSLTLLLALSDCRGRTPCSPRACDISGQTYAAPIAFYRAHHPATGDHLYTRDAAELTEAVNDHGYVAEGTAAGVLPMAMPGTVPLYRLWLPGTNDHFYTIDAAERASAIGNLGYRAEGVSGYVFARSMSEVVPVLRSFNPGTGHHFYTTDAHEHERALQNFGFLDEGIACYAMTVVCKPRATEGD